MKTSLRITMLLILTASAANGQLLDSLRISIGNTATAASKSYQPLWLFANKFGTVTDRGKDLSSHFYLSNKNILTRAYERKADSLRQTKGFYLDYGLDLYTNNHFSRSFIQEGYLKIGYKNWEIRGGRYEEITGEVDPDLSTGSLGISGNALPVPKVGIAVTDYTNVPFTKGFVQFKGQFSHGWMGNNRYVKGSYLHEKTFYLRFGKKKFKLFGGVQHFGEWGGRIGNKELKSSWARYWDVVFLNEGYDQKQEGPFDWRASTPGDQRGLLEAGAQWENHKLLIHAYNQMPFDSGGGVDRRNTDRLLGVSFTFKKPDAIFKKVLLEFISTKKMNNWFPMRHRQSYYNNGGYVTGWEYEDNIIGNPLFVNRVRGSKYFSDIEPYDWNTDERLPGNTNIINNRIVGGHVGALYRVGSKLKAKTLLTFTRNYGTYRSDNPFFPAKNQWYSLHEFTYTPNFGGLNITAGIAVDHGSLGNNEGFVLGLQWDFIGKSK